MVLTIASNAHELAARAADNARFDMQSALEEVATAEKIIRRCESSPAVVGDVGLSHVIAAVVLLATLFNVSSYFVLASAMCAVLVIGRNHIY